MDQMEESTEFTLEKVRWRDTQAPRPDHEVRTYISGPKVFILIERQAAATTTTSS